MVTLESNGTVKNADSFGWRIWGTNNTILSILRFRWLRCSKIGKKCCLEDVSSVFDQVGYKAKDSDYRYEIRGLGIKKCSYSHWRHQYLVFWKSGGVSSFCTYLSFWCFKEKTPQSFASYWCYFKKIVDNVIKYWLCRSQKLFYSLHQGQRGQHVNKPI